MRNTKLIVYRKTRITIPKNITLCRSGRQPIYCTSSESLSQPLSILIFLFYLTGSDGALTRTPESTTLIPGTLLRLTCGTDLLQSVLWSFTAEGSSTSDTVAGGTTVTDAFKPYFYLDTSSPYDLVAHTSNANESYCGTYMCTDNDGGGESSSATVASKCT